MNNYIEIGKVEVEKNKFVVVSQRRSDKKIVIGQLKIFSDGGSKFLKNSIILEKEKALELKEIFNKI